MTVPKAIQIYVLSNFEEAVVDWEDWDFDMAKPALAQPATEYRVSESLTYRSPSSTAGGGGCKPTRSVVDSVEIPNETCR